MPMTPEERRAYDRRHARRVKLYGRAPTHPCAHCAERGIAKPARDWATIHGTDGENPHTDYIALCKKCHHDYDDYGHHTPHTEETKALLSQKNRGYVHTPEAVEKIRAAALNPSDEARAKMAAGGRKGAAARKAAGAMPGAQREKIRASLKGNANATGTGRRTGQALENIKAGQQRRRERERAEKEARAAAADAGG
jgi:NUMOD3 motif